MKNNKLKIMIAIALFTLIPFQVFGQTEEINQIVQLGLSKSFDIKVENERMDKAYRTRWNNWSRLLPSLSLSGGRNFDRAEAYNTGNIDTTRTWYSNLYATASWRIWDNMQNITNIQQGQIDYQYQKNSSYLRIQEYIIRLIELFLDYELVKKRQEIETRRLEENQKVLEQTKQLLDAGVKTRMDVLDVEIQVVDAQRSLSEITTRNSIAKQNLLLQLNSPENENLPGFDFFKLSPYYEKFFNENFEDFKQNWNEKYLQSHFEIKNLSNSLERSRLSLRQSRLGYFPRLDFTITEQWDYSRRISRTGYGENENGVLSSTSMGLQLTWTVWDWFATPNNILNEGSNFKIADTEYRRGLRTIQREITNSISQYELNEIQLKAAKMLLEKSEMWVYHSRERFKLGRLTNMELQRAINQTYQAKVNVATYLKDKYIYMARILYHMGHDLAPETSAVPWR
jgi:outer membrane protein